MPKRLGHDGLKDAGKWINGIPGLKYPVFSPGRAI